MKKNLDAETGESRVITFRADSSTIALLDSHKDKSAFIRQQLKNSTTPSTDAIVDQELLRKMIAAFIEQEVKITGLTEAEIRRIEELI